MANNQATAKPNNQAAATASNTARASILACVTCQSMVLITDENPVAIADPQKYMSTLDVFTLFDITVCKTCEENEALANNTALALPRRNIALNFDMLETWKPYVLAHAYTNDYLWLHRGIRPLADRSQYNVKQKVFRTIDLVMDNSTGRMVAQGIVIHPYLRGDFF